jgi:hypothetical protein
MATQLTNWQNFLWELQGKVQEVFPTEHVLLAELSGVGDTSSVGRFTRDMDTNREIFSGKKLRIPIVLAEMQMGGAVSESGTWNVPAPMDTTEASANLTRQIVPFDLSVDVERDSLNNSSASAVAMLVRQARQALATMENDQMNNSVGGSAILCNVASNTGSAGLTIPVSEPGGTAQPAATSSIWNRLYPGRIVDVLTRSNGANPGNGLRRKITSVSRANGTITVSTSSQASDGSSGNVTFSSSEGIYIPGSYGNGVNGLEDIAAVTGTFEGIDKAATPQWQATDGRAGVTTTAALSDPILDGAVNEGRRAGLGKWDFGIGDPRVIDLYKQGKYAQVRYDTQSAELKSGFKGIVYEGADAPIPLIKEPRHQTGKLKLIDKASLQLYGDQKGPAFLDDDGAMFRRFSRTLIKEADLLDRVQLVALRCNTLVFVNNLDVAT